MKPTKNIENVSEIRDVLLSLRDSTVLQSSYTKERKSKLYLLELSLSLHSLKTSLERLIPWIKEEK